MTMPDTEQSAIPPTRAQQRVIEGAGLCVDRLGLEATTVDDIATASGLSRATVYRKFASKEAIFDAMVAQDAEPFAQQARQILQGEGVLALRIEHALSAGILNMPPRRWLQDVACAGVGSLGTLLFQNGYRERSRAVLALILQSDQARPGLELDSTLEWFMRELMWLVAARPWAEAALRKHVRNFVVPVLIGDAHR